jgi:hypothetical protein
MNNSEYIESAIKQFQYYKLLGEKAMEQIPDDKLNWQYNPETNSVAIIVKHLWGNMMSRWVDFLTKDGEKVWRDREAEFINDISNRKELMEKWEEGWKALFDAMNTVAKNPDYLGRTIFIRNLGHTIMEATNRQVSHYAYHVGQIVHIGKMIQAENWKSLSIPRGKTSEYNAEKFSQPPRREHFTEELTKRMEEK